MRKVLVVAIREYKEAVVSKAFVISLVAMPILWGGAAVAQFFLKDEVDTADKRVAVVDRSGQLYAALAAAAEARNAQADVAGAKQLKPRFLLEAASAGEAPSTLALSDRVRRGELFAFVEIAPDVLEPRAAGAPARVAYYSNSPTYEDFQRWLSDVLNAQIQSLRLARAGLDAEVVRQATQPEEVDTMGLVSQTAAGHVTAAERVNPLANIFLPMGMMLLMFMAVMVGASPLLQNVLEEKLGRVAEMLLGSVSPFQLMLGKLLGSVGVSLTIVSVYLAGGYLGLRYAGYADFFPTHLLGWFLLFQALAVLMYGSIFGAIGAAVSDMKEAQSALTPAMLVAMAPLFVWLHVVKEPSSTFSTLLSFFPPATPMLMIVRQAVPPGIALWQPLLGVVLVVATTLLCVFASGRVFRVGLLMQGKGADFRQMFRWVLWG